MGACCSPALDANTQYIDSKMSELAKKDKITHKLLFLGPGRSGKSTIFRQLQWLHGDGFNKEDCLLLRKYIYYHIISQMEDILKYYAKKQLLSNDDDTLQNAISLVKNNPNHHILTQELATAIQYIWDNEDIIKNVFDDPGVSKYQVLDETTQYFWNEMDRIKDPQYVPNETDIINFRYRTTGVIQKEFQIENVCFNIFDVGGQKSERKKWIHCFNEVAALIFVISLSCYNEMMYEDKSKNCMVDSLILFDEIINNKCFSKTHIILFLNKTDLFKKKIKKYPITECPVFDDFDEYKHPDAIHPDPNDYDQTKCYIRNKFHDLNQIKTKHIYTHFTFAMDRNNVKSVFYDVRHVVTNKNLETEGFI